MVFQEKHILDSQAQKAVCFIRADVKSRRLDQLRPGKIEEWPSRHVLPGGTGAECSDSVRSTPRKSLLESHSSVFWKPCALVESDAQPALNTVEESLTGVEISIQISSLELRDLAVFYILSSGFVKQNAGDDGLNVVAASFIESGSQLSDRPPDVFDRSHFNLGLVANELLRLPFVIILGFPVKAFLTLGDVLFDLPGL